MQTPNLKKNSQPSFGNSAAFTQFLRFLETNQAWGATAVDVTCMGMPRTAVDMTRSPEAGLETMRREFSSTADDALVGAFGVGVAMALSKGLNKKYDIKAHKMFVSDEALNILGHTWNETKGENQLEKYLHGVISKSSGYNPDFADKTKIDDAGWVKIDKTAQKSVVERLAKEIKDGPESITKEAKEYLRAVIGESTGAEHKFKLQSTIKGKEEKAVSNLDTYIDNIYKVSKAFMKKGVAETFNGDITHNKFLNGLKKINKNASIGGVAIATGIGLGLQPLNMYLTRKKTGKTGFVGVEGREPDKSTSFKVLKGAIGAAAGYGVLRSIGKTSEIMGKIRFKGFAPTLSQYKFVYGFTIVSRLLSARDKNELRESSIKDSLGFVNWLILGGFVSKFTAAGFEKMNKFKNAGEKFIRYNEKEDGKGFFNWLTNSNIVNRDEALFDGLKKAGRKVINEKTGKALSFKEMMKEAKQYAPMAVKKVKALGVIQFAGYIYSGIVLGWGIPKLNIAITNSVEKKRKAQEAKIKDAGKVKK